MRLTPTGTLASWLVFVNPLVLTLFIIRRISSALTVPSSCSSSFKTFLCAHHEERGVKRRGGERRERGRRKEKEEGEGKGERGGKEKEERGKENEGERRERGRKEREGRGEIEENDELGEQQNRWWRLGICITYLS